MSLSLADYVPTFGQAMLRRYGRRVHKIAIDAAFTCPNRDGSFQAYTNTYADVGQLDALYREALSEPDVHGSCMPDPRPGG